MKKKSLIALALVLCLTVTCFAGCGEQGGTQGVVQQVTGVFDDCLLLEQIGVVDRTSFSTYGGGLVYTDSETKKIGIISVEGLIDSGAIYEYVREKGSYFAVMTKRAANANDLAGLNTFALVAGNGRQIVGPYYAAYDIYGDYVVAYTATSRNDAEGHIKFYSKDMFEVEPSDAASYDGKWEAYNIYTGAKLEGVSGTGSFSGFDQGIYLCYKTESGYVTVDAAGTVLDEDREYFDDGSYAVESQVGEVFANDGTKLFAYDLTGFIPYETDGENYIAKRYLDGATSYVIMNKSGEVISTEFKDYITLTGNLVLCNNVLQTFEGKAVLEGECDYVKQDRMFGNYYVARAGKVYTMLDDTGAVYISAKDDDKHSFYTDDFVAFDKTSGDYMFYNHKTQSYDIKGYSMSPWVVKSPGANSTYELVDTMTGDVLLSGYREYSYNVRNPETYYIYAKHNAGADVFLVTSMKGFQSMTEKKVFLLEDLQAAFAAEGLSVTVNSETGEMAMDASVLFGGDSSALTADGKALLNKFIKAYSSVVYSDKYNGFISCTMVEGHTAPVSGSTYAGDLALSQERADNVMNYILSGETGVDLSAKANNFEAVGHSNSQPVYNADGTVNMDASRRVSFRFLINVNG